MRKGFLRPLLVVLIFGILGAKTTTAGTRIVSDIDDTIKLSNVRNIGGIAWYFLFENESFVGMSELYQEMATAASDVHLHYLSGGYEPFRNKLNRFLSKENFPAGTLTLRPLVATPDTLSYKIAQLREMLVSNPDDDFILIGDDTEHDFTAYSQIYSEFPHRILSIYIRSVQGLRMLPAIYRYSTALDVAHYELNFFRLRKESIRHVAQSVLAEKKISKLLPSFQSCPPIRPLESSDPEISEWNRQLQVRLEKICSKRKALITRR